MTGTPAGDPIEAEAISTAFFDGKSDLEPLYVGSIKTIIGHTEGTAGLAGLMKASLALQHGVIPPNLHLNELSPAIKPFYTNLRIARESQNWPELPPSIPRRASVNSFGFGGTNCHVIIESFRRTERHTRHQSSDPVIPFNFSAASGQSLANTVRNHAMFIRANPYIDLRDLSWTLNTRKSTLLNRVSVRASTLQDLASKLESVVLPDNSNAGYGNFTRAQSLHSRRSESSEGPRLLGIFTGQGAQWATMGAELLAASPLAADSFERLQQSLDTLPPDHRPSWSLKDELLKPASSSCMSLASMSQPLCTAVQIIIWQVLRAAGLKLDVLVGHSSGEIALAFAAGYISDYDAIRIAYYRGMFVDLAGNGAMLAVTTTHEDADELCNLPSMRGRIRIAAFNSPTSVTLSGDLDAIADAEEIFADEKKFCRRLRVDKAYHSPHMTRCTSAYLDALRECDIRVLSQPERKANEVHHPAWVSTVSGREFEAADALDLRDIYWARNMTEQVLFSQAMDYALGAYDSCTMAIEIGPHPALQGPVRDCLREWNMKLPYVGTLERGKSSLESLAGTYGSLWEHLGDSVLDYEFLDNTIYGTPSHRVVVKGLPSYPWVHDRVFWHESRHARAFRISSTVANHSGKRGPHPLLGTTSPDETPNEFRFKHFLKPQELPWLLNHKIQDQIVFPAAGYISAVVEAIAHLYPLAGIEFIELSDVSIGKALVFPEDESSGVETLLSLKLLEDSKSHANALFSFFSALPAHGRHVPVTGGMPSTVMSENASGQIRVIKGQNSTAALAPPYKPSDHDRFLPVEAAGFYSSVAGLGYHYQGEFQGLSIIRRKLNEAIGTIKLEPQHDETALILHPAALDCAIQAILVAHSHPGDGRLGSLHVPTRFDRLDINPSACHGASRAALPLQFFASVSPSATVSHIRGDVEIHSSDGLATILQLTGIHTTPLVPPTAESDRSLFFDMVWRPKTFPSGNVWHVDPGPRRPLDQLEDKSEFSHNILGVLRHLTHLHAHLHILEIAGYTNAAPLGTSIVASMPETFASYSVAYPDSESCTEASSHYLAESSGLKFVGLGLADSANSQGLIANSYDIAIIPASVFFTSSETFTRAIKSARALLRAGGYLIIPGVHSDLPADEAARTSLIPTRAEIGESVDESLVGHEFPNLPILIEALGFSAPELVQMSNQVDLANPEDMLVCQALDERVQILRNPLTCNTLLPTLGSLSVICADNDTAQEIRATVSDHFSSVQLLDSLNDYTLPEISRTDTIVNVNVGEDIYAVGEGMSTTTLSALKQLFRYSKRLLWVTIGAHAKSPNANIFRGIQRVVSLEFSDVRIQSIDFADGTRPDTGVLAKQLLQFAASCVLHESGQLEDTLWCIEPEIMVQGGQIMVPRLVPNSERNNRYNSARRPVTHEVPVQNTVLSITMTHHNDQRHSSRDAADCLNPLVSIQLLKKTTIGHSESAFSVRLTHSLLQPVSITESSSAYLSLAERMNTPERVFVITKSLKSHQQVLPSWACPAPESPQTATRMLAHLQSELLARVILQRAGGRRLVVLNPGVLLGRALIRISSCENLGCMPTLFSTSSLQGCATTWVYLHSLATERSIRTHVPRNTGIFVDMSTRNSRISASILNALPPTCQTFSRDSLTIGHVNLDSDPRAIREEADHLQSAWLGCQNIHDSRAPDENELPKIWELQELANATCGEVVSSGDRAIVSWTGQRTTHVSVQPASQQVTFAADKTYWLVGLTGGLGLSLCQWMAERGAKYFALSSRKPTANQPWLDDMSARGCTVKLFRKLVSANAVFHRKQMVKD